jgi:CheY-like chemotaxis protein
MNGADGVPFSDSQDRAPTILIVDDEALIRLVLSDYLKECGFKIVEAGSAAEAVEIIKQGSAKIDLVFSDVRMPGQMDGIGLAKWVRENRSDLPVFLASGDIGKTNIARELCAEEPFFAKPYDLDAVANKIRHALVGRSSAGT